jgi:hypothetical protein
LLRPRSRRCPLIDVGQGPRHRAPVPAAKNFTTANYSGEALRKESKLVTLKSMAASPSARLVPLTTPSNRCVAIGRPAPSSTPSDPGASAVTCAASRRGRHCSSRRPAPPHVEVDAVEAESKAAGRATAMTSGGRGPAPSPIVVEGEFAVPAPWSRLTLHRRPSVSYVLERIHGGKREKGERERQMR